jgi:hypothetical protein
MNNHLGLAGINLVLDLRRAGFFYESTRILRSNLSLLRIVYGANSQIVTVRYTRRNTSCDRSSASVPFPVNR